MVHFTRTKSLDLDHLLSMVSLGTALTKSGEYTDANESFESALTGFKERPDSQLNVAIVQMAYSASLIEQGLYESGEKMQRTALATLEEAQSQQVDLASVNATLLTLAKTSILTGRYNRAVSILETLVGDDPENPIKPQGIDFADALQTLSSAYYRVSRVAEQLHISKHLLLELERRFSRSHPDYIKHLINIGLSHSVIRDDERAEFYVNQGLALLEASSADFHGIYTHRI